MEEDPIWEAMNAPQTPRYCMQCGTDVGPYEPSEASQGDVYEYGQGPPEGTSYYQCDTCEGLLPAPCKYGTGFIAPCGHFIVPLHAKFCWICGADPRRQTSEPEQQAKTNTPLLLDPSREPMPRTTHQFPFERKVAQGIGPLISMCNRLADSNTRPPLVLLLFDETKDLVSVRYYGNRTGVYDLLKQRSAKDASFLSYDPVDDGLEYIYLCWRHISREKMERLIGVVFSAIDFISYDGKEKATYPTSWNVMF